MEFLICCAYGLIVVIAITVIPAVFSAYRKFYQKE